MPKNLPFLIDIGGGLSIMSGLPAISSWNTAGRPRAAKPGTFGFNSQTHNLEYWDGRSWYGAQMSDE